MSDEELRDVWEQAAANADGEANNYFYEREIQVEGVTLLFDVDADLSRDTVDSAIYYQTPDGGADDLVFAKRRDDGLESDVVETADEFITRVHDVAEEWRGMYFDE